MTADEAAYQEVGNLYDVSRELNSTVNTIHPEMVQNLLNMAEEIRSIPRPSGVQNQLLRALDDIIAETATIEDGIVNGYRPINNQRLIDQVQSLRQVVDFDFAHGQPKNIFRPAIREIQSSVIREAQSSGNAPAAEALQEANAAYREWTTTFNNDYINPYRDISNRSYSKLYDKIKSSDDFVVVRDIIGDTAQGREILGAAQRDIVEKAVKPFIDNPRNISQRALDKTIRELEPVLNPGQIEGIREEITTAQRVFPKKIRVMQMPEKVPIDIKAIQKYTGKTPESIEAMGNTRSGIRELKKDLSSTSRGRDLFDKFSDKRIEDILREGKVKADYSGKDLARVMNNKKNFELISELTSPELANELLKDATKLGNKIITSENLKKIGAKAIQYKILKGILRTKIPLL